MHIPVLPNFLSFASPFKFARLIGFTNPRGRPKPCHNALRVAAAYARSCQCALHANFDGTRDACFRRHVEQQDHSGFQVAGGRFEKMTVHWSVLCWCGGRDEHGVGTGGEEAAARDGAWGGAVVELAGLAVGLLMSEELV